MKNTDMQKRPKLFKKTCKRYEFISLYTIDRIRYQSSSKRIGISIKLVLKLDLVLYIESTSCCRIS